MNYKRYILKNGLRVILVPINEMQSATTMLMVGAGSRYETRDNNGISHFLEHMAFKGTKKRPTALEISSLIDGIGAEFNAFTSKEVTSYYIKSSYEHIPLCLDVIADMLSNLLLDQVELDKERGVINEELNLYEDTPTRKIVDVYERLLYGDTPMGWDVGGVKEVINKINREDFIAYMQSLYSAHNMTLIIAGRMNEEKVRADIEKYFVSLARFDTINAPQVTENQTRHEVFLKQKDTEQAHFALGVRTVGLPNEADRYPLSILSSILGGGMSSRLFHEVREKRGLAYYVRTSSESYLDCGYLSSFAGVDVKRIDDAIKVTVEEYQKVTNNAEITEEELKKAKEFTKGHFILDLEDTRSLAAFYATSELLEKKLETPEAVVKKIDAVTLDDVQRVAGDYLSNKPLSLAIIGNYKDQEHFEALLS